MRACTVLVDGRRINSYLTLAVMKGGAQITTIEGLAKDGALRPELNAPRVTDSATTRPLFFRLR